MSTIWLIFFVGILLFIVISALIKDNKRKKTLELYRIQTPSLINECHSEFLWLEHKLNKSLSPDFIKKVKIRVLTNHPTWTDNDFDWRLFELKRYFILAKILKTVPMFSEEVDEVWHEMLMFTKEYEAFSHKFYGSFLHHTPNIETVPIPNERAFFDWMYLQLFEPTANSRLLWGPFFRHPLEGKLLENFRTLAETRLLVQYFKEDEEAEETQRMILQMLKEDIQQAGTISKETFRRLDAENNYTYLLPAMVYFSMYEAENYQDEMKQLLPKEAIPKDGSHGSSHCSGCSSFACDSGSGSDSSCSSSSCSSGCGGGCGSS
ncbi:hypothetical protein [Bacillus sp. REN10]|uniref:hypothetical protein n=1 Tax=Bacillus sp. REN10 TaxID=2782541 RepID=UPI00193B21DF|nr:hypothetical protein [Bacillus sp. REN10]